MRAYLKIVVVIFLQAPFFVFPQKSFSIIKQHLSRSREYVFYNNDILNYRLKGECHYRQGKIVNLSDSNIVFANDSVIQLKDLKVIRIKRGGHLALTMQQAFVIAGIGFASLNTINNAINGNHPVVDIRAVYIATALVGASLIIWMIRTKHIRINRKTVMETRSVRYSDLQKK